MKKIAMCISLHVFCLFCLWAKTEEVWMSYNVQNLFDGNYIGTEYQSFNQQRWNEYYAQSKILQISHVFSEIHRQHGTLGLVLLQEVENLAALEQLRINTPSLQRLNIIFAKKQDQAVGTAIMTHHTIKKVEQLDSSLFDTKSRPILMATIGVGEEDVLVIGVHLPSQRDPRNQEKRVKAMSLIANQVQRAIMQGMSVFLGGDFNQDLVQLPPSSFPYLNRPEFTREAMYLLVNGYSLIGPYFQEGTYVYRGNWQKLDYLFFSYQFFDRHGLQVKDVYIFNADFLLTPAKEFIIRIPRGFRQNQGTTELGYSDHLPILSIVTY
ncbi:MAG: endonuclease/exonuclease/phosphatase family protein [Spirochaetia bacterium]